MTPLAAHGSWGELLKREGSRVEYFFVREGTATIAGFMIVTIRTYFITYAYSPRGPIVAARCDLEKMYRTIAEFLKKRQFFFWRIEPTDLPAQLPSIFRKVSDIQPSTTLAINIAQTPEELLRAMHQKTRYNIRLALKKNLEVCWKKDIDLFWTLSRATSERDGFRLHSRQHYQEVIGSDFAEQIIVYAEGKPVASAVCTFVGNVYTYLYGASSYEARAFMAPYLIQWSAILRAQEHKAQWYDFYGLAPLSSPVTERSLISPEEFSYDSDAKEAGYTRFKLGFSGSIIALPGTWDVVFSPGKYVVYELLRYMRRFKIPLLKR